MNAQEDETNSKGSDGNFSLSENCNEGDKECYKTGNIPQQIHVEKGMDTSKMYNFPKRKCKKCHVQQTCDRTYLWMNNLLHVAKCYSCGIHIKDTKMELTNAYFCWEYKGIRTSNKCYFVQCGECHIQEDRDASKMKKGINNNKYILFH